MAKKSNAKEVARKLAKLIHKVTTVKNMKLLGQETVEIIVDRTRNEGKGVKNQFGNKKTLKPVTANYAKWRRSQKRHPKAAKGRKSNLTFSGNMLDSLKVIKATKQAFNIGWSDQENRAKAAGQSAQGREFIRLGKAEVNKLIKFVSDLLNKEIRKS